MWTERFANTFGKFKHILCSVIHRVQVIFVGIAPSSKHFLQYTLILLVNELSVGEWSWRGVGRVLTLDYCPEQLRILFHWNFAALLPCFSHTRSVEMVSSPHKDDRELNIQRRTMKHFGCDTSFFAFLRRFSHFVGFISAPPPQRGEEEGQEWWHKFLPNLC